MDLIYRTGKHRETLERVRKLHSTPSSADQAEETLDKYRDEVGGILDQMRTDQDYDAVRIHYILLFAALVVLGVGYAIYQNALMTPLYILLALVFFIWLAHRIMRITINEIPIPSSDISEIAQQLQYARNGIFIKKRRLLLLSTFYILFFPILMLLLRKLGMGPLDGIHPALNFILAVVISTGMWVWYYNLSFDQYDEIEETLDIIEERVG